MSKVTAYVARGNEGPAEKAPEGPVKHTLLMQVHIWHGADPRMAAIINRALGVAAEALIPLAADAVKRALDSVAARGGDPAKAAAAATLGAQIEPCSAEEVAEMVQQAADMRSAEAAKAAGRIS